MPLRSERIAGFVICLIMLAVSAWGYLTLPDAPMAVHFGPAAPMALRRETRPC